MKPSQYMMLLMMLLHLGCSVKEDRTACPCRLTMDFSGVDTSVVYDVAAAGGFMFKDTVSMADLPCSRLVEVPRSVSSCRAWCGDGGMMSDDGMLIPSGTECPPIYMHCSTVDTEGELAYDFVQLRKCFCRMTVVLTKEEFPFRLGLRGNVCGYDRQGRPLAGDFYCPIEHVDGIAAVNVPRQSDSTLVLEVWSEDYGLVKVFSLGEYVDMISYDWNAPDLEDMTVYMDYAHSRITISVERWDKEYIFDITV